MPKIYTEQQTTELYHSTGTPGQAIESQRVAAYGKQFEAQSQQYEAQAKNTYSNALKISADETMMGLYNRYKDDPVSLKDAFKKAYDKSIGEIVDDDVKVDFMANVSLKSQTYLTKAMENKRKKDYRIAKSTMFDGIDKNTNTIGMAFSTLLGDDFNPDNVVVYNDAMASNERMINFLNEDGSFMFSDEQRKEKRKAMSRVHLVAVKDNFNELEPYQRSDYVKRLSEDNIEVPVGVDEDKQIVFKNLQEILSQEDYSKFKDYADSVMKKATKIAKSAETHGEIKTPEEVMSSAIIQQSNKDNFTQTWKDLSKKLDRTDTIYEVFDYRNSLQETFNNDGLEGKDYQDLMAKTVKPVIDAVEKQGTGKYRWWNDSFKVGAYRINELMNFQNQPQEVKAAAYELLYRNFGKYNLNPTSNFEDSDLINKCVNETVKQLATNNDPSLLGVNAQRVLSGTSMINFNTTDKPKKAGELNYVIKIDPKTKIRYKFYKHADGSVDNNSAWVRLK